MQPTNLNLKAIAREATLRGDTKTLFHALDLLERRSANRHLHGLLHRTRGTPPARGAPTAALRRPELLRHNQHYLRTMSATLAEQFEGYAVHTLRRRAAVSTAPSSPHSRRIPDLH